MKIVLFVRYCGKYGSQKATDNNGAHAHCMLDNCTDTLSEYVILIVFPRQQWLREHASVLRYT